MFDTLTPDERLALNTKLATWSSRFCEVGHTLARAALARGEYQGELWTTRTPYVDTMHELHELRAEVAATL